MTISIDGENLRYCSDYTLNRAKSDIEMELARRCYDKIQQEEQEDKN